MVPKSRYILDASRLAYSQQLFGDDAQAGGAYRYVVALDTDLHDTRQALVVLALRVVNSDGLFGFEAVHFGSHPGTLRRTKVRTVSRATGSDSWTMVTLPA